MCCLVCQRGLRKTYRTDLHQNCWTNGTCAKKKPHQSLARKIGAGARIFSSSTLFIIIYIAWLGTIFFIFTNFPVYNSWLLIEKKIWHIQGRIYIYECVRFYFWCIRNGLTLRLLLVTDFVIYSHNKGHNQRCSTKFWDLYIGPPTHSLNQGNQPLKKKLMLRH